MRMVFDDVGATVHNPIEEITDDPIRNRGAELLVAVVVTAHGSPVEGHVVRRDRLADAVGFGQRRAQPLLRIDSSHSVLRAEDDRLGTVYRRGGHAHDVGLFGLDHFPIIEIRVGDAEPLLEPLQALLAAIGDGDDFRLLDGLVGAEVAIGLVELAPWRELVLHQPAHAPGADDRHPILCPHSAPPRCCPRSVIAAAGALHRARQPRDWPRSCRAARRHSRIPATGGLSAFGIGGPAVWDAGGALRRSSCHGPTLTAGRPSPGARCARPAHTTPAARSPTCADNTARAPRRSPR